MIERTKHFVGNRSKTPKVVADRVWNGAGLVGFGGPHGGDFSPQGMPCRKDIPPTKSVSGITI